MDGKTIEEIVATGQEEARIEQLQTMLRTHRYQFAPVRVVEIPKPKGGTRPLGIATVADRVAQTAMKLVLDRSLKRTSTTAPMATGPSAMPSRRLSRSERTCTTVRGVSGKWTSSRTSPAFRTAS